jgi:hypothetical protein
MELGSKLKNCKQFSRPNFLNRDDGSLAANVPWYICVDLLNEER